MARRARKFGTLLTGLLVPARLKPAVLNLLGHHIHRSVRIKFSLLLTERMWAGQGVKIGRFNFIRVRRLVMRQNALIGSMNVLSGPANIVIGVDGAVGNRNTVTVGLPRVSFPVSLRIGETSKVTAAHKINLNESLVIGTNSVLGGAGIQIWTHGFVHQNLREPRPEIRGRVTIGNNVYVGAACCISPGVTIGDNITIGAHSSVATSLSEPGVYVSQPLRHIPASVEQRLSRMPRISSPSQEVPFFWKPGGGDPGRNVVLANPEERR